MLRTKPADVLDVPDLDLRPNGELVVERVGKDNAPSFQDIGIEYHRYIPKA